MTRSSASATASPLVFAETLIEFGLSDSQIYHCAGDSICVPCIISLVSQFENLNHEKIINDYVETKIIEERKS